VGIGGATIAAGQRRAVEAFLTGTGEIELIRATVAGDVAWLLLIERSRVEFAGYDEPQPWELRVTEVFRRTGGDWERVHRHADPLVNRRTLAETLKFRA
jgi:ketosteroid isomerase-like protein